MLIDSHHHLWSYDPLEYPWIDEEKSVLKQDFLAKELGEIASVNGVELFITVQARQSLTETRDLLAIASACPLVAGVVGWAAFADVRVAASIEEFAGHEKLRGFRHVVQDEPDERFLDNADFNRGIDLLAGRDLVFELLVYPKQLPAAIDFADRHEDVPMVLDHVAKPVIRAGEMDQQWERNFRELARRPHVACKFSGLATEVRDEQWSAETIRPYWDVALEAFGSDRLMYGSDWPVCLLASTYSRWLETVRRLVEPLRPAEQDAFFSLNAARVYGITIPEPPATESRR